MVSLEVNIQIHFTGERFITDFAHEGHVIVFVSSSMLLFQMEFDHHLVAVSLSAMLAIEQSQLDKIVRFLLLRFVFHGCSNLAYGRLAG